MERESKKKRKQSFLESLFYSIMQSVLRAAINDILNNLFGDLEITDNRDAWIDDFMQDASVVALVNEAVQDMTDSFYQAYEQDSL